MKTFKISKSKVLRKNNKIHKTITSLVLKLFDVNPKIKSNEMIGEVKKKFKNSKFKLSHFSWFKYQIKKGKYKISDKSKNLL